MRTNFNDIFRNKNVLVTGHTGFKGSWLSLWLKELGANVSGYALEPPTDPSLFYALELQKKMEHTIGDVRDGENLKRIFDKYEPEMVFHMAAQPLVRFSYKDPKLTYETNVLGTVNVLEAVRQSGSVRTVINVTSDKCYENREWEKGYKETDPIGGYDPYSSSKGCSELVTAAYRNSFFNLKEYGKSHKVAIASARAGNVIGGGDFALDRLVPDCVRALSKNETILTRNPHATRPWQHVLEPVGGYLLLAQKLTEDPVRYSGAWNFGPADNSIITVEDVIKKCISYWGQGNYKVVPDTQLHEANLLKLDIGKAMSELSWRPRYSVDAALEKTVKWYRDYYNGRSSSIFELTLRQILEY